MLKNRDRMYFFLLLLTIGSAIGFQGWRTLFNNFAVEQGHITGAQMGVIQSIREIPGFLALLVVYLLFIFKEHILARISVLLLSVGTFSVGFFPHYNGLIMTTLIMSIGFHYYETVNQSLSLQYFSKQDAPLLIAKLKSIASITNIVVGGTLILLMKFLSYKSTFILLGIVVSLFVFATFFFNPTKKELPLQHKKMILRKKYWLFYVLTFLSGARRQLFVVFSVFLMVDHFHFSVVEISTLFVINNLVNYFAMPFIGKAINYFGERKVLCVEYIALIPIFLAYAYVQNRYIVMGIYILDHVVYNFALGLKTFFQKIADPQDIAPSMAVSFTINHIAAVVFPVLGGALWTMNYKIPFFMGVGLACLSLLFSRFVPVHEEVRT